MSDPIPAPPPQEQPADMPAPAPGARERYLGTVQVMGIPMRAYDIGGGLAALRPVSPLGLEGRREWVVPLKGVLRALKEPA